MAVSSLIGKRGIMETYWRRCRSFRRFRPKGGSHMPVPKANQRAVDKYVKNNYDRINVTMPKGKKETIQDCAAAVGQSVNTYINAAIDEKMKRDSEGGEHHVN